MGNNDIEVVGILLTFSKTLRRIRIQNVYRVKQSKGKGCVVLQNSVDKNAALTFSGIFTAFERLYEQRIEKVWISETNQVQARYYQFNKVDTPNWACLPGNWFQWAER